MSGAGWFRRAWAFLFDVLVLAVGLVVLVVVPDVVLKASGWFATNVLRVTFVLSLVFVVAYPVYFIGQRGQTPGMKLLQIRLYRLGPAGELHPPTYKVSWGAGRPSWAYSSCQGPCSASRSFSTVSGRRGTSRASVCMTRQPARSQSMSGGKAWLHWMTHGSWTSWPTSETGVC